MRKSIYILVFLIIIACRKDEFGIVNLNGNKITALGHGGMGVVGNVYPSNSYESISKCLNLGMDGTEIDVQMTKDSVLVAFHNEDLSDNTNLKGLINSKTWTELKSTHYKVAPYLSYSIITLEQLFSHIQNPERFAFIFDCKFFTENKNSQFYTTYLNAMVDVIQKYQLENNIYIESDDKYFLKLIKSKQPEYKIFLSLGSFDSGLHTAMDLKLFGILISTKNITKEQIEIAHHNNLRVILWDTYSASDNTDAIRKNPDFIITDDVRSLNKLLN